MSSEQPIVHKEPAVQTNPFAKHLADHVNAGAVAIESERAIAEAQGKLVIAKRFPRDQARAYAAIIDACKRPGLAEEACYSFPRGGQTVSGPSIRLAEMLAANWGNIDYGIRELSRKEGVSEMEAYCWDLETNTMSSQKFTVRHIRDTRGGGVKLTEERDIYELTANMGGRRLRARVLAILPADLIQAAVDECGRTLAGGNDLPIADRVRNMLTAFKTLGIQPALVEKRLGHGLDTVTGEELADLRKIHNSIRDGVSKINDWFGDKPSGDSEHMEGDPVPDRPAPKPRSPKGAALVKDNPKPVEIVAEAEPTPDNKREREMAADEAAEAERASERKASVIAKPVNPLHAEGEKIIAEANAKVVAHQPLSNEKVAEVLGRAASDHARSMVAGGLATSTGSRAATEAMINEAVAQGMPEKGVTLPQRPRLNDGEIITVEAQVNAFKIKPGTSAGKTINYISAEIVSPEFKGEVADKSASPLWTLDAPLRLTLRGGPKRVFVDKIEAITEAPAAAQQEATDEV